MITIFLLVSKKGQKVLDDLKKEYPLFKEKNILEDLLYVIEKDSNLDLDEVIKKLYLNIQNKIQNNTNISL